MADAPAPPRCILVTGAAGFIGRQAVAALAAQLPPDSRIIATDVRPPPVPADGADRVEARVLDIRGPSLAELCADEGVDAVLHLAAVVNPPPGMDRAELQSIEVGGTRKLVDACLHTGVRQLVYTSSGAAYGYHADNPALLTEDDALRGNEIFAYADHKRRIEELLARVRLDHPALGQLVFRVSTILGPTVDNQITAMFERPVVIGVRGADTPFCFVWDADVVACLVHGLLAGRTGVFNLTGRGVMTLREIAHEMGGRYVALPEAWLRRGLALGHDRGWTGLGPEQVIFLKHRPVLSTARLEAEFGVVPRLSSREVFALYRDSRRGQRQAG